LRVGFPEGYIFFDDITENSRLARLTELSKEYFNDEVSITIEVLPRNSVNDDAVSPNGISQAKGTNDVKNEALNHPLVQKVMDVFEGAELCEVITRDKDR
jgi:DNA polymerase-3 subunit gamma/tau